MINVVMPVYIQNEETLELTKSAIYSLGDCKLIVVDNDSSMGGGYLRAFSSIYIKNNTNLGFAKAVNQGFKMCTNEFIAVANNDIRVSPNWQSVAKEVLSKPDTYSCHFRMTSYEEPFAYGNKTLYEGMERWCTSSFFVIKGNPYLFDEHYFNSYEDWDYWMTVRKADWKTAYTDKACYQHHHSFTQQQIPEREANNQRNREYFKKKWGRYAENIFTEKHPDQMAVNYLDGFCL